MAARAANMVAARGSSSSSSSEDDEELRRCQEAVWDARGHGAANKSSDGDAGVQPSKRVVVADHEHDGNELQVTDGFRTHVAKKLGTFLDSCITELQAAASSCVESNCDDEDDEGFRLFSTSVPGQTADEPPAPVKRRPVSSSSDSDSEMETRLREAAVSIRDLLPSAETPCAEKPQKKKLAEEEESQVVKKKKKKKRKQSKEEGDCAGSPLSNGEIESAEQERVKVKLKKKKKKKKPAEEEEETLN